MWWYAQLRILPSSNHTIFALWFHFICRFTYESFFIDLSWSPTLKHLNFYQIAHREYSYPSLSRQCLRQPNKYTLTRSSRPTPNVSRTRNTPICFYLCMQWHHCRGLSISRLGDRHDIWSVVHIFQTNNGCLVWELCQPNDNTTWKNCRHGPETAEFHAPSEVLETEQSVYNGF